MRGKPSYAGLADALELPFQEAWAALARARHRGIEKGGIPKVTFRIPASILDEISGVGEAKVSAIKFERLATIHYL